jgi:hypothetical protein
MGRTRGSSPFPTTTRCQVQRYRQHAACKAACMQACRPSSGIHGLNPWVITELCIWIGAGAGEIITRCGAVWI